MSTQSETHLFPSYKQLVTHLRTPLYRNGYFLMISSLATSGIGLVYWILAAHRYSTYTVGINSALIAAMTFIAGISELNLMSALIRFVPLAGRKTKRFVLSTYLVSFLISSLVSVVFIENLSHWSPALVFLGQSRALSIWFILTTMSWCIFVLQDSVLTGLRQTSWVPIENSVFSLTKIALMMIFAVSIPALGIFASWSFALIVAIIPTNYFIFKKLIPIHMKKEEPSQATIDPKQVARFAATDYLGALFWLVANTLMPVIVTTVSGPTANAYFYLAWTIANTLYLISTAMGSSLVVETAKDQKNLGLYSRRAFMSIMKIVVPTALFIFIGAPYILMIFGKGYSSEGTAVLRLLALSAIPNVFNATFVSVARVQRKMGQVALTLCTLCSLLVGSGYLLLKIFGISGVGIGWLASQSMVAIIVYGIKLRKLWANIDERSPSRGVTSGIDSIKSLLYTALVKIATTFKLLPVLLNGQQKWASYQKQRRISRILPEIIDVISLDEKNTSKENWHLQKVANNQTSTAVAFLRSTNGSSPIVVKIPASKRETDSLIRQNNNLTVLNGNHDLNGWSRLLPKVICHGTIKDFNYFAEYALAGIPLNRLIQNHDIEWGFVTLAVDAINILHQKTAQYVTVDPRLVQHWVYQPIQNIVHSLLDEPTRTKHQVAIQCLQEKLFNSVLDKQLFVSWIHGDFSPANILVDPLRNKVTGIVDWDLARPDELPMLDLLHLLVSIRMETEQHEMGRVVSDLLLKGNWKPVELGLIHASDNVLGTDTLDVQDLLLLAWLRHINANLSKTSRFDHHTRWVSENILPVLQVFQGQQTTALHHNEVETHK